MKKLSRDKLTNLLDYHNGLTPREQGALEHGISAVVDVTFLDWLKFHKDNGYDFLKLTDLIKELEVPIWR